MEEERVRELIEEAIQPLRNKIEILSKENQQLKMQLFMITHPGKSYKQRSSSKEAPVSAQERPSSRELRTPSIKKREEKEKEKEKPVWGYGRSNAHKQAAPPMADKVKHLSPRIPRANSKQQISPLKKATEKDETAEPPKIMGGRRTPKKQELVQKESEKTQQSKEQSCTDSLLGHDE